MPFIGNQPALSYTSFAKQDFTTSATTSYTLDNPVTNENELALFINFVRQEPTTAYTATGTTLTLTSATSATDDMYCVFLGKAVQTVNPPNGSVGTAQLADDAVTTAKILDANVTSAKLASGVLPTNTPAFLVFQSSNQSISNTTTTILQFGTENIDTDNAYSSNRFTVPTGEGGLYHFALNIQMNGNITGANIGIQRYNSSGGRYTSGGGNFTGALNVNIVTSVLAFSHGATLELNAGDYVEATIYHGSGSTKTTYAPSTWFGGYKLIGVS